MKLTIHTQNSKREIERERKKRKAKQNSNLWQKHTTLIHDAQRFFVQLTNESLDDKKLPKY